MVVGRVVVVVMAGATAIGSAVSRVAPPTIVVAEIVAFLLPRGAVHFGGLVRVKRLGVGPAAATAPSPCAVGVGMCNFLRRCIVLPALGCHETFVRARVVGGVGGGGGAPPCAGGGGGGRAGGGAEGVGGVRAQAGVAGVSRAGQAAPRRAQVGRLVLVTPALAGGGGRGAGGGGGRRGGRGFVGGRGLVVVAVGGVGVGVRAGGLLLLLLRRWHTADRCHALRVLHTQPAVSY